MQATCFRKTAVFVLGLAALLVLNACGVRQIVRGEVQPPRVNVLAVTPGLPERGNWPLTCTLRLENPNQQALDILGYDYQLAVEGKGVAQGASQAAVHLPPMGQSVTEFPILVKLPAVFSLAPAFLAKDRRLDYEIAGGVRLASLLGGFRVPFRFRGQMTVQEGMDFIKMYGK